MAWESQPPRGRTIPRLRQRPEFPALLIVAVLALQMAALDILAPRGKGGPRYVKKHSFEVEGRQYCFGLDYHDYYRGSLKLRRGESPYTVARKRYVTPPIPALVNLPLSFLPFGAAYVAVAVLTTVALLLSFGLSATCFFGTKGRDTAALLVLGIIALALSYPVYFLVERGNIDAFVVVLTCLGLFLAKQRGVVAGLCLASAIGMKVYPALALVPLAIHRRFRALLATGAFLLLAFAATPSLWVEFGRRVLWRTGRFGIDENASIICTFVFLGGAVEQLGLHLGLGVWKALGLVVYAVLLGLVVFADWVRAPRRGATAERVACLMYLPFMVAVPQRAYHYELVALLPLIPVLCHLWTVHATARARGTLVVATLGVALSQWQAVAWEQLSDSIVPHCLPGVGLFVVMLACTWYKLRPGPRRPPAA